MATTSEQQAYQYLIGRGLTPAAAAGVVGNLQAESGLDPTDTNSIGAYGIGQWLGPRRSNLEAFAVSHNESASALSTQLDFLWSELQGPESGALAAVQAAPTPQAAAQAFEASYERSGGALLPQRESYAADVYNAAQAGAWGPDATLTGFNPLAPGLGLFPSPFSFLNPSNVIEGALKDFLTSGLVLRGALIVSGLIVVFIGLSQLTKGAGAGGTVAAGAQTVTVRVRHVGGEAAKRVGESGAEDAAA